MIRNPRQLHLMRLGLPATPANGGGGGTTVTKSDPWAGQQPFLNQVFQGASNQYYDQASNPSASVAGFTPMQQQAMQGTQNIANQTDFGNAAGVNNSAGNYTTNLLNGQYLNSNPGNSAYSQFANGSMVNSNPYQTGALNAANDAITRSYQTATAPQTASAFEGSGRYGSGAYNQAVNQNQQGLASQLGNTDASMLNSMYQNNMQNMLQGAQGLSSNYNTAAQQQLQGSLNAPNIANSYGATLSNLYNMGGNQQALNQAQIQAPWQLLNNYSNLIQGQYGGQTSTPYYTNQMAGAMGGALGGAALGGMTGLGSGYGAAAGALASFL